MVLADVAPEEDKAARHQDIEFAALYDYVGISIEHLLQGPLRHVLERVTALERTTKLQEETIAQLREKVAVLEERARLAESNSLELRGRLGRAESDLKDHKEKSECEYLECRLGQAALRHKIEDYVQETEAKLAVIGPAKAVWNLKEESLACHYEQRTGLVSAPFTLAGIENLRLKVVPRDSSAEGRAGLFLLAPAGVRLKFKLTLDGVSESTWVETFREGVWSGSWAFGPARSQFLQAAVEIVEQQHSPVKVPPALSTR